MDGPIDEESRRSANLARRLAAGDVAANPVQHRVAEPVGFEARNVEPQLGRIAPQVLILEGRLAVKEEVVNLPEAPLRGARLGRAGGREGVRVDLGQREVPEGPRGQCEPAVGPQSAERRMTTRAAGLDAFDTLHSMSLEPLEEGVDHVRGPVGARVILEYGDYECPYSRQASRAIELVERRLDGGVRFAFRHFPLTEIHPHALAASGAAEAGAA